MSGAPFLQVLTRCFRRPSMLAANLRSVAALGGGVEHTLLVDCVGRGVGASYEALATVPVRGQYIWILDDDDVCVYPDLARELRQLAVKRPDVVVVRMDHGGLGVLPDDAHWGTAPELGSIGCSACIVRREVWLEARSVFVPGSYTSDFAYASYLLDTEVRGDGGTKELHLTPGPSPEERGARQGARGDGGTEESDLTPGPSPEERGAKRIYEVEWLDVVASRVQRRSLGAAE